jgi:hypothetical protein
LLPVGDLRGSNANDANDVLHDWEAVLNEDTRYTSKIDINIVNLILSSKKWLKFKRGSMNTDEVLLEAKMKLKQSLQSSSWLFLFNK